MSQKEIRAGLVMSQIMLGPEGHGEFGLDPK